MIGSMISQNCDCRFLMYQNCDFRFIISRDCGFLSTMLSRNRVDLSKTVMLFVLTAPCTMPMTVFPLPCLVHTSSPSKRKLQLETVPDTGHTAALKSLRHKIARVQAYPLVKVPKAYARAAGAALRQ